MELEPSPHQPSKGMSADSAKYLQAVSLAGQLGKTVEEVLAFMGTTAPALPQTAAPVAVQPPAAVANATLPLPTAVEDSHLEDVKVLAPKDNSGDDKFVITEVVELEDASEEDLNKLAEEEEENDWSDKIRVGSKVKIVYMVSASRINWVGKKGKVVRIVGNEHAKIYEVEFQGGKLPKIRLNKKTGKLEKGYEKKVIRNTFSEDQVEISD